MKNINEQLKNISHVRMTEQERNAVRSSLLHYAFTHPYTGSTKIFFRHLTASWQFALVAIFFVATSGSVSAAAGTALPGDLLYPVKVHVNEEVKGFVVSTNPQKKIEWQKSRIETRIKETETLVAQNTLTIDKQEVLEKNIKNQVKDFAKTAEISSKSEKPESPDSALNATLELETTLKDYQNKLTATVDEEPASIQSVEMAKRVEESVEVLTKKTDEIILEKLDSLEKEVEKVPVIEKGEKPESEKEEIESEEEVPTETTEDTKPVTETQTQKPSIFRLR